MDKEQFEAEMMQLENEIQSRQFDADRFYDDSLAELKSKLIDVFKN